MIKITREHRINFLTTLYEKHIRDCALVGSPHDGDGFGTSIFNQIIIDSIGLSGLIEVKNEAWKNIKQENLL